MRDLVTQGPLTPKQVAARFAGAGPAKVQPILDTLAALSLLRWVETENAYAAQRPAKQPSCHSDEGGI
ncbi:hypothetical protein [Hymenobacter coccineus]|uniref:hypothetical protein n=1 Tax=Hymenobacter coccineus TaxID=1908235 RepID=UPI000F7B168A|nr:hypothetical protein [Hymenobacter coccineus]